MTHRSIPFCASLIAILATAATASGQEVFDEPTALPVSLFTNYIQLVDLDGDLDLDIVAPNCFGFMDTDPQPFEAYENDGAGAFSVYALPTIGNKAVRMVALGDIERDGDVDMVIPDASTGAHLLFVNDGTGTFTDEAATRLPALTSRVGATEFADVDGDGDLDLFLGDGYSQGSAAQVLGHILINDGTGVFTEGAAMPTNSGGADPIDVDFVDIDRDFDLDILLNMHEGPSRLWINDGAGVFTDSTASLPNRQNNFSYGPSVCDADGDGDLDIFTDNVGPSAGLDEQLAINGGNLTFTDESVARILGNPAADDNGVICVDANQDGHLDMAVVSLGNRERFLYNDGTGIFTHQSNLFPVEATDDSLWLDFGDLNGDGRLDAVTGQGEPNGPNRVYLANSLMPVDAMPPRIIAVQTVLAEADVAPTVRFAVSDSVVSDAGPRLSRAHILLTDGDQEIEAAFAGGDLFQATLPALPEGATVTFSACATDLQGNADCGAQQTYTVGAQGTGGAGGGGAGGNGTGGQGTGAQGANGSGGNPAGPGETGDDDGCGCVVVGSSRSSDALWLLGLAGLAALVRRRRG